MNKLGEFPYRLVACLCISAACVAGCKKPPATPPAVAKPALPSAEISMQSIVDSFRRIVEDTQIGFYFQDANGHSAMVGKNKVSHELIRPAKPDETYKAIITVTSESHYSLSRETTPTIDESARDQGGAALPEDENSEVEILDSNLVTSAPAAARSPTDPNGRKVARRPDVDVRKYELVYKDGRWVLVTELDLKTERLIQDAFERVLKNQA